MTEFRQSLLDRIIHLYGFEDEVTVWFAHAREDMDTGLEAFVKAHEEHSYTMMKAGE